jgi:ketosteroid isomerase-like protein
MPVSQLRREAHSPELPLAKELIMSSDATMGDDSELMLAVFAAVERRDTQRLTELVHPDFEVHWPRSLPYGGSYRDLDVDAQRGRPTWAATWNPLQPTAADRRMDPRIIADNKKSGEVVVLWRQRGRSPAGERFDGQVLGLYQLRDGRLARAQMFYFDTVALARFLANANLLEQASHRPGERERDG